MKDLWYLILIFSILTFAAGCTIAPVDVPPPPTTPLPEETPVTTRPVASSDLPDFDYANVPVISPDETDWMTTNASYIARLALRDEAARAMYLGGGTVEGVLLSCHPTPFPSTGDGCAPALRIANETVVVDFLVDETEGRVITTVTEIREGL
ncbi:hypothetical protein [Methanofollis ethanolicus]|uniref:hypothetical protein n=1 Tax=Methanofollis ethanolicus TaxID=488124 RepID=UPI000833B9B1|nr:hypothetical protein [Methanofollis ethanolicus]